MDARILLVEDDPSIREVTAIGLRNAGFTVEAADDGRAGLDRFAAAAVRPGAARRHAAADRRSRGRPRDPAHVHGAHRDARRHAATPSTSWSGSKPAPTTTSIKPYELPELVARVRAALRRVGRADEDPTPQLRLGPLRIDLAGRTVSRDGNGEDIPLTRTEFDLLVELARHPGQVLARDTLLDRIWGYDYLGDSRLVDVAVGRLRAKVEADPSAPELILTVRGAGYKAAR